jgi:hypothetical protein
MDLLGVDVGFSKTQKSTGIACLYGGKVILYRADSSWETRKQALPGDFMPEVIALDGPLLPADVIPRAVRVCEQFFSTGLFNRRCKPGLSHFGTGFLLREAARETGRQFGDFFYGSDYALGGRLVEAFPNLFLGVMVPDSDYLAIPKLRRGQKFDWLYGRVAGRFQSFAEFVQLPGSVYDLMSQETDHELRAALVCLLTAALAQADTAVRAGSAETGWFWLPPLELWEPWAIEAAQTNLNQ